MTPEEQQVYDKYIDAIMIQNDVIEGAKQDGVEEGLEQGLELGLEQGRIEGRMEGILSVARTMKSMGSDIASICKITGLEQEEVQKL